MLLSALLQHFCHPAANTVPHPALAQVATPLNWATWKVVLAQHSSVRFSINSHEREDVPIFVPNVETAPVVYYKE